MVAILFQIVRVRHLVLFVKIVALKLRQAKKKRKCAKNLPFEYSIIITDRYVA